MPKNLKNGKKQKGGNGVICPTDAPLKDFLTALDNATNVEQLKMAFDLLLTKNDDGTRNVSDTDKDKPVVFINSVRGNKIMEILGTSITLQQLANFPEDRMHELLAVSEPTRQVAVHDTVATSAGVAEPESRSRARARADAGGVAESKNYEPEPEPEPELEPETRARAGAGAGGHVGGAKKTKKTVKKTSKKTSKKSSKKTSKKLTGGGKKKTASKTKKTSKKPSKKVSKKLSKKVSKKAVGGGKKKASKTKKTSKKTSKK